MKKEVMEMAVASRGPHANHLHLASDRSTPHHSIWMLFLMPHQQCQSTEGNFEHIKGTKTKFKYWRISQGYTSLHLSGVDET